MDRIKIKFWGVRGSIPTPGPRTLHYGGNTSCVEVCFPHGAHFILDAGSGIRELGKALLRRKQPVNSNILLSHFHWDHIQGLPFFRPAFHEGNHFDIYGCDEPKVDLSKIISMQMNPTYFPVAIEDMKASVSFHGIKEQTFEKEGVTIASKFMNHPGYTLGFRLGYQGRSLVYICDNEPFQDYGNAGERPARQAASLQEQFESFVEDKEAALVEFIAECDLLIHDAQYFPNEYQQRISWGHSPYTYAVDLAVKGKVKRLVLFHHDPDHDDETVDHLCELSRQRLLEQRHHILCEPAQEGVVIAI